MPMHAGSAGHAALNVLYVEKWDQKLALEALRASWSDVKPPLEGKHAYLTRSHVERVLVDYIREREENPTMLEEAAVLGGTAETALVFDWPNAKTGEILRIGGKPDLPVKFPTGAYYIVDHKWTTMWLNSYWENQFRIGHQLKIYAAMMQERERLAFEGGYINAVYMGKEPKSGWDKIQSSPTRLVQIDFSSAHLAETWEWVKALQAEEKLWTELDIWPQDEKACGNYGGCEFLELCQATGALRESLMRTKFEAWRPTGILVSGADGNEEVK